MQIDASEFRVIQEYALRIAGVFIPDEEMDKTTKRIETPMCEMDAPVIEGKKLVLVSILRAGNGLLDGILELVPAARVGFVGLYRDEETLKQG